MSRYKRYSNPYSVDVQRYSIYNQGDRAKHREIQPGDEFVVTVKDMDGDGRGVSFKGRKKVIVPRAVTGEKVRVRVIKIHNDEVYATVIERLEEPKR